MLVLERTAHQKILIGDDITVEVLGVAGGRVRLGIAAPHGVEVDREEVRTAKIETGHYPPNR